MFGDDIGLVGADDGAVGLLHVPGVGGVEITAGFHGEKFLLDHGALGSLFEVAHVTEVTESVLLVLGGLSFVLVVDVDEVVLVLRPVVDVDVDLVGLGQSGALGGRIVVVAPVQEFRGEALVLDLLLDLRQIRGGLFQGIQLTFEPLKRPPGAGSLRPLAHIAQGVLLEQPQFTAAHGSLFGVVLIGGVLVKKFELLAGGFRGLLELFEMQIFELFLQL